MPQGVETKSALGSLKKTSNGRKRETRNASPASGPSDSGVDSGYLSGGSNSSNHGSAGVPKPDPWDEPSR